jgi:ribosomal protein S18 acetylase RimI-like enzyme
MSSIQIHPAYDSDIESLADLLFLLFTQESDFKPDRDKQIKGLKLIINNPDKGFILVAKDGHTIAGMVSILKLISTAEGGEVGILEDMIVYPDYQGMGIGSQLIKQATAVSRKEKLTRLTLLTDKANIKAIDFYVKHEFNMSEMIPLRKSL